MMDNFPEVFNFNRLILKLIWFIRNKSRFTPLIDLAPG